MSVLGCAMMVGSGSVPLLNGISLWLDASDSTTITKAYQNLAATGSGTSGSTVITAASTETNLVQAGEKIRIGGTDIYTVASVSTVTINTIETLTANYVAQPLALDRVSQWNDKSGLGNNVTQGTALNQPVYNPAQLNSNAVMTFDGVSTFIMPSGLYFVPNGDNTIFAIGKYSGQGVDQYILGMERSGVDNLFLRSNLGSGIVAFVNTSSNGAGEVTVSGITKTNYNIYQAGISGTTVSLAVNNGTAATATGSKATATVGTIGGFSTGASRIIGGISEIIIYNRALSASEIVQVNRYLSQKWGITIS